MRASGGAVDDVADGAIRLDGNDLVQLLLTGLGLEQAAHSSDFRLGH